MRRPRTIRQQHQRSGSALLSSVVVIIMLTMLAAVMVDYGYVHASKSRMQNGADAAALAAAMRIGNKNTQQTQENGQAWAVGFANNNLPGKGKVLVVGDVIYGNWNPGSKSFTAGGDVPNAVQVRVRRDGTNTASVGTFFMKIFGKSEVGLTTTATATVSPTSSAQGVPMALPAPGFGSVSSSSDGPSSPANGKSFALGEKVVVYVYGDSDHPSVHLTLDTHSDDGDADDDGDMDDDDGDMDDDDGDMDDDDGDMDDDDGDSDDDGDLDDDDGSDDNGTESNGNDDDGNDDDGNDDDVHQLLNGTKDPVEMQVGDEVKVFKGGGGSDDDYGEALDDRLQLSSDDSGRDIVMAVVDTLSDSRDDDGKLTGKIRISDFVAVHLDGIVEKEVVDPDDSSKMITVKYLMGTVTNRRVVTSWGGATPSGAGGSSVRVIELVQ